MIDMRIVLSVPFLRLPVFAEKFPGAKCIQKNKRSAQVSPAAANNYMSSAKDIFSPPAHGSKLDPDLSIARACGCSDGSPAHDSCSG
jgi:hypothetical protein